MESFAERLRTFYLKDLINMPLPNICAVVLLVLLGIALFVASKKKWTARTLAYAALCLAISYVLSCLRLYRMPSGGSVVLCAMLPLVAFSYYVGVWQGLLVGVAFGLLQILQGAWIVHPVQGALDYVIAYAALALGGLMRSTKLPEKVGLPVAMVVSGVLRWAIHVISGLVFFAQDALDAGQIPFLYSALYNGFLFPEIILSALIAIIPGFRRIFDPLKKATY